MMSLSGESSSQTTFASFIQAEKIRLLQEQQQSNVSQVEPINSPKKETTYLSVSNCVKKDADEHEIENTNKQVSKKLKLDLNQEDLKNRETPRKKRKLHFEVTRQSRQYNKVEIRKKLTEFNKYLSTIGLAFCSKQPISIKLLNESKGPEDFTLNISNEYSDDADKRISILNTIFVTDSSYISTKTYHKIRKELNLKEQLPPINQLSDLKKSISSFFQLRLNRNGCFLKYPLKKVEFVLKKILENLSKAVSQQVNIENDTFIIKISGDGKILTKSSSREINNIVFTVVNEVTKCKTSMGNYILGCYEVEKNTQAEREEYLKELMEPFKNFDKVTIGNKEYRIVQKFCADMKFIVECYGLVCSHSSYGCIYCEANLREPWKNGDEKMIHPINRTLQKSSEIVEQNLNKEKISKDVLKGYVYKPLLHIEFNMIVIDTLHLFLRISDKLFATLISILNENDVDSNSRDFGKRKNLKKFFDFLESDVKICKPYYFTESQLEKVKLRSFNGTEREKIFEYFFKERNCFETLFPNINPMKKFSNVFNGFWVLFSKIKDYTPATDLNLLDRHLRIWLFHYIPFLTTSENTLSPYVHIFVFHMKELLELHGNINLYNTQGLERLNSTQSSTYFRTSNKHTGGQSSYIKQLVDNKNRNDFHNLNGNIQDLKTVKLK